jgi:hypothetical protein
VKRGGEAAATATRRSRARARPRTGVDHELQSPRQGIVGQNEPHDVDSQVRPDGEPEIGGGEVRSRTEPRAASRRKCGRANGWRGRQVEKAREEPPARRRPAGRSHWSRTPGRRFPSQITLTGIARSMRGPPRGHRQGGASHLPRNVRMAGGRPFAMIRIPIPRRSQVRHPRLDGSSSAGDSPRRARARSMIVPISRTAKRTRIARRRTDSPGRRRAKSGAAPPRTRIHIDVAATTVKAWRSVRDVSSRCSGSVRGSSVPTPPRRSGP